MKAFIRPPDAVTIAQREAAAENRHGRRRAAAPHYETGA